MSGELFLAGQLQTAFLTSGSVILLRLALLVVVVSAALCWRDIRKALRPVPKQAWLILAAIVLAGILFRLLAVPQTQRIYFDEDLYENMAANIARDSRSCICNQGWGADCQDCIINKDPSVHPFMLSLLFQLSGTSHIATQAYSAAAAAISTILIFLCAYLLFRKRASAGILAAAFLSILPVFNIWANSFTVENTSILLSLLAFLALLLLRETESTAAIFLFTSLVAMAAQVRPESGIFLPTFFASAAILKPRLLKRRAFYLAGLLAAALCSAYILLMFVSSRASDWGAGGPMFSAKYFLQNLPVNLKFFISGYPHIEHPPLVTIFFLAGLAILAYKRMWREGLAALLWLAPFFLLYTSFYAGSVLFGVDVRYVLVYYPAFVLVAAAAGLLIGDRTAAAVAVVLALYFTFFFAVEIATPAAKIEEAKQSRAYWTFVNSAQIPANCTVISHVTAIYSTRGIPTAQYWYLYNPAFIEEARRRTDCILLDYDYWCSVPPNKPGECISSAPGNSTKILSDSSGTYGFYLLG